MFIAGREGSGRRREARRAISPRSARGPRRRRRNWHAPRRRRRDSSSASISFISLAASSSSSGTRDFGRWVRSALSISMPGLLERVADGRQVAGRGDHLVDVLVERDVLGAGVDRDDQVVLAVARARRRRSRPACRTGRRPSRARRGCRRACRARWRTSAPVRLRLSVSASISSATPAGAVALVETVSNCRRRRPRRCPSGSRARCCPSASRRRAPSGSRARARVAVGVSAALPGRDRDRARELGEVLAATGVDDRLLVLDRMPISNALTCEPDD